MTYMPGRLRLALLAVLLAYVPALGHAQEPREITLWTARALATVLAEVGPQFEQATGYRLKFLRGSAARDVMRKQGLEPVSQ